MISKLREIYKQNSMGYLTVILTVFICTFFIYSDFNIRMRYGFGLLLLAFAMITGLAVLSAGFKATLSYIKDIFKDKLKLAFSFVCLTLFVLFLRPDSRHDESMRAYTITMLITLLYVLASKPTVKQLFLSAKLVVLTAMLFSLAYVVFGIFPSLYWSTIYKVLSQPSQEYARKFTALGYGTPIGGGYSYSLYIISAAIIIVLIYSKATSSRKKKCAAILLAGFYFLAIVFSGRRSELLVALFSVVLIYLLPTQGVNQRKKVLKLLAVCLVLLILLVALYPVVKSYPALYRYTRTIERMIAGKDVTTGRYKLWSFATEMFNAKPIFGNGLGSFASYIKDGRSHLFTIEIISAHNIFFDLMAETGVIGTILMLASMLTVFIITIKRTMACVKNVDQTELHVQTCCFLFFSLTVLFYFLVLYQLDTTLYKMSHWPFIGLAIITASQIGSKRAISKTVNILSEGKTQSER